MRAGAHPPGPGTRYRGESWAPLFMRRGKGTTKQRQTVLLYTASFDDEGGETKRPACSVVTIGTLAVDPVFFRCSQLIISQGCTIPLVRALSQRIDVHPPPPVVCVMWSQSCLNWSRKSTPSERCFEVGGG